MTYNNPEKDLRRILNHMNYFVSDEQIEKAVSYQAFRPSHTGENANSIDFNWEQAKPGITDNSSEARH